MPSGAAVHSRALGFGSTGGLCMAKGGRNHVAGLLALTVAALVAVAVPAFALGTSRTAGASKPSGKLYAQTNGLSGNQIVVFQRYADGSLKKVETVSTGGKGGAQ